MFVLSGMPVLETHIERRAVYCTTTREVDQDNFVKKRTDSTAKSLLSVRTGLTFLQKRASSNLEKKSNFAHLCIICDIIFKAITFSNKILFQKKNILFL